MTLFLAVLLLTTTACGIGNIPDNPVAQETASNSSEDPDISMPEYSNAYRDVIGYMEGFVAVGYSGTAVYVDFSERKTTINTGVEDDLLCVTRWREGFVAGGADGTILISDQGTSVESMKIGDEDIIGIDIFNGQLYAITRSGTMYVSDTGRDWESLAIELDGAIGLAANNDILIAAAEEGSLWIITKNDSRLMDYSAEYNKISVTGIASDIGGSIWLLSENASGEPLGIYTDTGEFWTERPFQAYDDSETPIETKIHPLAFVYNDVTDQALILGDNGKVLTVTTCETCDKLSEIEGVGDLLAGDIWYDSICIVGEDGYIYIGDYAALRQDKISGEQAAAEVENGGILIDVNSTASYTQKHVKGATHIELEDVAEQLPIIVPDHDRVIIFYCTAGRKSQMALEIAQEMGYTRAYSMGGLDNWPYDFEIAE